MNAYKIKVEYNGEVIAEAEFQATEADLKVIGQIINMGVYGPSLYISMEDASPCLHAPKVSADT